LPFQPKLLPNYSKDALNLGFFFSPYLLLKVQLLLLRSTTTFYYHHHHHYCCCCPHRHFFDCFIDLLAQLWVIGWEIYSAKPESPVHVDLDNVNLESWVDQYAHLAFKPANAKQAVIDWFFQIENYPSDISKLSTYFAAKSVFVRLSNITQTGLIVPQIMRWEDGTGAVTTKMLNKIESFGGQIQFHRQVQSIHQDDNGATLQVKVLGGDTEQVETWQSSYVVVATALTNAMNSITYQPPLPEKYTAILPSLQVCHRSQSQCHCSLDALTCSHLSSQLPLLWLL
jgi:hypothetical protein